MVGLATLVAGTTVATACPLCDAGTGEQVRAGILDEHFGRTLVAILLPFPILLGVVAMIHFGGPTAEQPGAGGRSADDREGRRRHDDGR